MLTTHDLGESTANFGGHIAGRIVAAMWYRHVACGLAMVAGAVAMA